MADYKQEGPEEDAITRSNASDYYIAPPLPNRVSQLSQVDSNHRRERAIQELVENETTYNTYLGLLIENYVQPLADFKLISQEQHSTLFPQLPVIKNLSDSFLKDLKQRREKWDPDTSQLADLFGTFTPYFLMYQGYINKHEKSVSLMWTLNEQKKWQEYCVSVRSATQHMDLASLLILPIQRLPRYKLLLREILKNTTDAHPDRDGLTASLQKVEDISLQITSGMQEFERREIVRTIERKFDGTMRISEPHRQFIREGKLWKVCRNKAKLYHCFLFNDLFIYASSYGAKYKLHNSLSINSAFSVSPLYDSVAVNYGSEKIGRIFSIVSQKKSFVVYADTVEEAAAWLGDFDKCIAEQAPKSHFQTESHSVGIWVPDSHQRSCSLCSQKFSFSKRRHHCRSCGALVCSKCSGHKLPNAESVMRRACKTCYFGSSASRVRNASMQVHNKDNDNEFSGDDDGNVFSDDDDDDFENENAMLHSIPYYVDVIDDSTTSTDIFQQFGHGVGSYMLIPADFDMDRTGKNGYYPVTLVVSTQNGFKSFNILLFEKKNAMVFRLKSVISKDFTDMHSLLAHVEKKENVKFWFPIPRSQVENKLNSAQGKTLLSSSNNAVLYPRAKALFEFEAVEQDDLALYVGDIIDVLDREDSQGWWIGRIGQRQGMFPSTYVEMLDDSQASMPPMSALAAVTIPPYPSAGQTESTTTSANAASKIRTRSLGVITPVQGSLVTTRMFKTQSSKQEMLSAFGPIGKLMQIIDDHMQFMKQREQAIDAFIASQQEASLLKAAKLNALQIEKELMTQLIAIPELNEFLFSIITIENLFNSLYTEQQREAQQTARVEYAPNIAMYEAKEKSVSDAQSFTELMLAATSVYINSFKKWLTELEAECQSQNIKIASNSGARRKDIERAFYKAFYVYGESHGEDGFKHMTDVLRCSLVFDDFGSLYRCYAVIERLSSQQANIGGILRVKDRFNPKHVPFGYRDLMINMYCPGTQIVTEIQLHHRLFYQYKKVSHDMYKKARLFEENEVNMAYQYADQYIRAKVGNRVHDVDVDDEKVREVDATVDAATQDDHIYNKQGMPMTYDELLAEWKLKDVIDNFVQEGYGQKQDNAELSLLKSLTDEHLKEMGFKNGHIHRFRLYLKPHM